MTLNPLASSVNIILYDILHKPVGLKCETLSGWGFSVIRVVYVSLSFFSKCSFIKRNPIMGQRDLPIICQFLINVANIPSHLGAFI